MKKLILTMVALSCIGCNGGEAKESHVDEVKKAVVVMKQPAIREVGGDFEEQARAVLILGNLAAKPGPLLGFIRKCRMEEEQTETCRKGLTDIERGLSLLNGDLPRGDLVRLHKQLNAAMNAPAGEFIMSEAKKE